jgi:hypothetical protein
MRCAGHVARIGERRVAYRVLVGRPERRPFRRSGQIKEDNIKINLKK